MSQRIVAVIGLGRFGESLAVELANAGASVIAFDHEAELVERVDQKRDVTAHLLSRGRFREQIVGFDPQSWDVAVVAIGEDFEQQQNCVLALAEIGVRHIVGRAQSSVHRKILRCIGGDEMEIISPEIGFASQLAKKLARRGLKQVLRLAGKCELIEAAVPESMFGCSLKELRVGAEHSILVIGVRRGGVLLNDNDDEPDSDEDVSRIMPAGAETRLEKDDTFTLVGKSEALRDFLDLRLDR